MKIRRAKYIITAIRILILHLGEVPILRKQLLDAVNQRRPWVGQGLFQVQEGAGTVVTTCKKYTGQEVMSQWGVPVGETPLKEVGGHFGLVIPPEKAANIMTHSVTHMPIFVQQFNLSWAALGQSPFPHRFELIWYAQ
jgi:hypothetical protein